MDEVAYTLLVLFVGLIIIMGCCLKGCVIENEYNAKNLQLKYKTYKECVEKVCDTVKK